MKKVSVILPAYNEGERVINTIKKVHEFSKKNPNYSFIFVNDGSTDNTLKILKENILNLKDRKINILSYPLNRGKGYAVKRGVLRAKGDYIFFTDSDLAYSLEHLYVIYDKLENSDVVIGCRGLVKNQPKIKFSRIFIGKVCNFLTRVLFEFNFVDVQAGLKGFRGEIAKELFEKQTIKGFTFDVEILFLAKKRKYKISEIPAKISNPESYKFSKVNFLKDSFLEFFNLLKIRLKN